MFVNFFSFLAENFDLPILEWIAANLHTPFLDAVLPAITILGNGGMIWILWAVLLLLRPAHRKTGAGMAVALVLGLVVCNLTLKPLMMRMRPFDYQLEHFGRTIDLLIAAPHDYSFPSGHTIASFEAATVLMLNDRKTGIPAMILAAMIAFSRLYLYVHYPTDVIASVILGVAFGFLGNRIARKICKN